MEYVGEEKKIQELFHELRLETERVTPRFATVWSRAQRTAESVEGPMPHRRLSIGRSGVDEAGARLTGWK